MKKPNKLTILSSASDGSLVVMSDTGVRYEYSGTSERDVAVVKNLINKKAYGRAWQYLKKLRLFSKQKPGEKEKCVVENIFEHVLNEDLFQSNSKEQLLQRLKDSLAALSDHELEYFLSILADDPLEDSIGNREAVIAEAERDPKLIEHFLEAIDAAVEEVEFERFMRGDLNR